MAASYVHTREQLARGIHPHSREDGRLDVEVHQVVRDLSGTVISDSLVHHIYRFRGDRIASMDLAGGG